MNGELNFSISTEGLSEKGKEILNQAKIINEAINDINAARSSLESWVSTNKDRYDNRIANALPKMQEMVDVIDSYGKVAIQTSAKATEVERKIASAIDNNFLG